MKISWPLGFIMALGVGDRTVMQYGEWLKLRTKARSTRFESHLYPSLTVWCVPQSPGLSTGDDSIPFRGLFWRVIVVVYREDAEQWLKSFRTVSFTLKVLVVTTVITAIKSVLCRIMISFGRMEQLKDWKLNCCNRAEWPKGDQTLGIHTSQECHIPESPYPRPLETTEFYISEVRICEGLGFYPTWKLVNQPVTISWTLAEYKRHFRQRQRTSLLLTQ